MAHPAKYSSRLIRRIYEHMIEMEWLKPGDRVVDPFGGVALGALDAMRLGLHWNGVELEEKFFDLGNQNIDLWNTRFGRMPGWGSAHLINGDSRRLLELLQGSADVTVSSPPYAETRNAASGSANNMDDMRRGYHGDGGYSRVAASVSSPPYGEEMSSGRAGNADQVIPSNGKGGAIHPRVYGNTRGQLGEMKADGFEAAISSPPFLQSEGGAHVPSDYADDPTFMARHAAGNKSSHAYGQTDGQLSSMKDGCFEAAISSPPYSAMQVEKNTKSIDRAKQYEVYKKSGGGQTFEQFCRTQDIHSQGYGNTDGQLSNASRDDFWIASRAIVEQVYLCLVPGGHAVWVVKDYVKNKQIVPFSDQWRQLCEAVGFVTEHEHHAMLVHRKGAQHTLDGGLVEHKTESKSFFRRLAEKKGSPRIDWETVYCMTKL